MISEQIEHFWESLFDIKKHKISNYKNREGTVLSLPLERNALEQTKFAQWVYGDGLANCLSFIRDIQFSKFPENYVHFDYSTNVFTFSKPQEMETEEFYFLFDYIKEVYRDNGYQVTDSIKEGVSSSKEYKEIERYVLVKPESQHLVKLEVVNDKINQPIIVCLGYPVDSQDENAQDPEFFKIIKKTLN
ncbi:MAG: hypothetical protein ACI85Q_000382 [Salibacteraceae bacterium]|jgi:hypothetical protein